MSIRVSKPAVNLREKLSEIDIPTTGSHGSQLMKSVDASESFDLVRAGRKNMIINGAMNINQRNGTSSYTPTNSAATYGGPDRWCVGDWTDGSLSVNMDGDPPNYPETGAGEFQKAMQIACSGADTSLASTQNLHFFQNIEGQNCSHLAWGTGNAKPATLSFWVKTNRAGTYCVGLENNATNRCCIREYYQNGDNLWNKVVLTFPGCTDGTWEIGASIGIRVRFCLGSGTNFDDGVDGIWVNSDELTTGNQANFMDSTNNRFMITGVQLEEGTVATPFEHRSYGDEMLKCNRYYWTPIGTLELAMWAHGIADTSGIRIQAYPWPVEMRASPSLTYYDASSGGNLNKVYIQHPDKTNHTNISVTFEPNAQGTDGGFKYPYGISGFSDGQTGLCVPYRLTVSAEL